MNSEFMVREQVQTEQETHFENRRASFWEWLPSDPFRSRATPPGAWDEWGAVFLGRCPRLVWGAPLALNPGTNSRIFATASDASANGSNF